VIRLGPPQDRVDERGCGGAEIECGECAAVGWLYKRLILGRCEQQLIDSVAIVIQRFHARGKRAGRVPVCDGLGADQIAPKVGAKMRRVKPAEDSVPIGIVALRAEEQVARGLELAGGFRTAAALGDRRETRGDAKHFLVEQIRFRVLAEKPPPRAATKKRQNLGSRIELCQ
jgi:hypothetical protein